MIIKKFVGKTEEDAVEAARNELGSGVVIMNVKAVKRKGLAALFRAKQTEVTVALEEEHDNGSAVRREAKPAAYSAGESAVRREEDDGRDSIEKKLDNLQSLLMNRFQQSEAQREEGGIEGEIPGAEPPEEVPEETEGPEEVTEQQRFIRLLYNTMLESEVDEKYANQIIDEMEKNAFGKTKSLTSTHVVATPLTENETARLLLSFRCLMVTTRGSSPEKNAGSGWWGSCVLGR